MFKIKGFTVAAVLSALSLLCPDRGQAQGKLSIDKVYAAYLRNSGTIMSKGAIKGYFFLYQSDKIDRNTDEYTLQILDENLNKVKDIKFQDSKNLSLLEAAYNGGSLSFLFKNYDNNTLDMKIYDLDGKLKYTYSREYDIKRGGAMQQSWSQHGDAGGNKSVFDQGEKGYVSVMAIRDGRQLTYEVDYYSSETKRMWTYVPNDDEEKYAVAEYLGATDSVIMLEVSKRNRAFSNKVITHLVGINFVTKRKVFDIDDSNEDHKLVPTTVVPLGEGKIMVMGSFFDKDDNVVKDFSKGLAIYEISSSGKILSKTYNSWAGDMGKYLPTNSKGKLEDVGYLYIHKLIRTPENRMFVVGEGYKRQANGGGIAMNVLTLGAAGAGVTKMVITDMVIMEFDPSYKIAGAKIYEKTQNTVASSSVSDYYSQHKVAGMLKASGAFDYEFTTGEADNSSFAVCYSDFVRSSEYKGQTFNAIRYNGTKFSTDKIELKSKASTMRVFPAKAGSVMILEYFKKEKRIDLRLEKLG